MIQNDIVVNGIKVSDFPDDELTVQGIFRHNGNWENYRKRNGFGLRKEVVIEVDKMMKCNKDDCGFVQYQCEYCSDSRTIYFGCNSRVCTRCGKRHSDKWADEISDEMFDVPHRHVVLSMPERMWGLFKEDWDRLKVMMDSVIETLNNVLSHCLRTDIEVGAIVVLHPFSRDMSFKPHVHILMTEGGFDRTGEFKRKTIISFKAMRKVWQYSLLTNLKKVLPKTKEINEFIDDLFKDYREGFYAHLPESSRIKGKRAVSKYVGRYVRHPAIANFRLMGYDGKHVSFWYKDNQGDRHEKTMTVDEFMAAIVQHIPKRQFKMIRHYGAYSRGKKGRYKRYRSRRSIESGKIEDFKKKRPWICPNCGSGMRVVGYRKTGPPIDASFGEKIVDWVEV